MRGFTPSLMLSGCGVFPHIPTVNVMFEITSKTSYVELVEHLHKYPPHIVDIDEVGGVYPMVTFEDEEGNLFRIIIHPNESVNIRAGILSLYVGSVCIDTDVWEEGRICFSFYDSVGAGAGELYIRV